jgi:hypothetical protein
MNPKHTWSLVTLAAMLLGFILVFERHWRDSAEREPAPRLLPQLDPDTVTSVQVRPAGQPEIRADRTPAGWRLTRPLDYPAEPEVVASLLTVLRQLTSDRKLSAKEVRQHAQNQKEFGFDPPQFSILIQQGKDVTPVLLGNLTALKDQVFVQVVGQAEIYLAEAALLRYVPRTADDWRSAALVDLKALSFDRIAVTNGARSLELERDPASRQWRLLRPLEARADSPKVDALLEQLQDLRVTAFVSDDPKAEMESYGLQPPEWGLALARGTNMLAALQFGRSPTNYPSDIFVRCLGTTTVMRVPVENLAGWRVSLDDFRDRHLLALAPEVTAEIEVRGPESFTLRQVTNDVWQVTGTNGFAADSALVNDLLLNLTTLEVAQFVKTVVAPADLPGYGLGPAARQWILRSAPSGPASTSTNRVLAELAFGATQDGLVFARRADENSVYALKERDFQRLPVAAWQLRDRRIFHFAETNIAGVTLRRAGQVAELTRNGPNQWTVTTNAPPGLNDLALDAALHQLGTLTCVGWVARGPEAAAHLGLTATAPGLTVALKGAQPLTLQFGRLSARGFPLAATEIDGETRAFEMPWTVFQTLREACALPAPQR